MSQKPEMSTTPAGSPAAGLIERYWYAPSLIFGESTTPKNSPPATALRAAPSSFRVNRSTSDHLKIDTSIPLFRNVKRPATPSPIDSKLLSYLDSELSVTRSQFLHSPDPCGASLKVALDAQLAFVKEQFLECAAAEIIKNPDFCGSILEAALDKYLAAVEKDFKDNYKKSASIKTTNSDTAVPYSRNIPQMTIGELKEALATQLANTKTEFVNRYNKEQLRQAKSSSLQPEVIDGGGPPVAELLSIRDMVELYSPKSSDFEANISGSDDNADSQIDSDVTVSKTISEVERGRSMLDHYRGSHARAKRSRAVELVARKRKGSFSPAAEDLRLEEQLAAGYVANKKRVTFSNDNLTRSGGRTVFPRMDSFYNNTVIENTDDVKYFKFKLDGHKIALVQNSRTAYRISSEDLARAGIAVKDFADVHRFILNTTVKRIKTERLQREAEKSEAERLNK